MKNTPNAKVKPARRRQKKVRVYPSGVVQKLIVVATVKYLSNN